MEDTVQQSIWRIIYFELYPHLEKERHVYLTCIVVVPIGELMGELELS